MYPHFMANAVDSFGNLWLFQKTNFISHNFVVYGRIFSSAASGEGISQNFREFGKNFASNYWPFLLIAIGLILIIGVAANRRKRVSFKKHIIGRHETTDGTGGWIIKDIVFGGAESLFLEPELKGGDIDVVFGGIVIDLRQTTLPETTVYLNVDAVFGGITLYVPENWCVNSNIDSLFGGYSDKRPNATITAEESSSKLIIQGSLIFSGCTVQ